MRMLATASWSRTQFERAREHQDDYWLYVVEHTGDEDARIIRIQDPFGKARTFTFDRGWIDVAEMDDQAVSRNASARYAKR